MCDLIHTMDIRHHLRQGLEYRIIKPYVLQKSLTTTIYISRSKNRSDRYAVLSDKAFDLLVSYIRSSYRGAKPEDWLFPGQKDGAHTCEQTVCNVFVHQLAKTGLAGLGFNLHSLRHAFGLHLYESGADLFSIKEAMGHKSLSSTELYLVLGIGNGRSVKSPYDFG